MASVAISQLYGIIIKIILDLQNGFIEYLLFISKINQVCTLTGGALEGSKTSLQDGNYTCVYRIFK